MIVGLPTAPHLRPKEDMAIQLPLFLPDPSSVNLFVFTSVYQSHLLILFPCHHAQFSALVSLEYHHFLLLDPLLQSSQPILLFLCEVSLYFTFLVTELFCVLVVDFL